MYCIKRSSYTTWNYGVIEPVVLFNAKVTVEEWLDENLMKAPVVDRFSHFGIFLPFYNLGSRIYKGLPQTLTRLSST